MTTEQPIGENDHDIRLDRWFKRHHPGFPHSLLEKYLRKGLIRLDGKKASTSDRVQVGQVLKYPDLKIDDARPPRPRATDDDIEAIRSWVLYRDDNVIIINKPFGLPVQGGSKISKSVDDMLDGLIFDAQERPKLTHRLDRDTSGALVLARSARDANKLMHLFSGRKVEKTYWALVNNLPDPLHGTIDLPLSKKANPKAGSRGSGPEGRDYEVVQVDEENGQKAVSEYRVLDMLARKFALVELFPLTGRMHQLRVHMASIGCPILGDHKYGGGSTDAAALGVENILHLHARRIVIPALGGGKTIDVKAPLPEHMKNTFKALGLDVPKR